MYYSFLILISVEEESWELILRRQILYICKYALFKEYWHFFRHWDLSSWESGQDTWLWHEGIHGITICTLSCPKSSQNRWSSTYGCFMAHRTQFSFCKLGIFYFFSFKNGKKPLCCGGVWFVLFFPLGKTWLIFPIIFKLYCSLKFYFEVVAHLSQQVLRNNTENSLLHQTLHFWECLQINFACILVWVQILLIRSSLLVPKCTKMQLQMFALAFPIFAFRFWGSNLVLGCKGKCWCSFIYVLFMFV